jgi:hypothetical protein
MLTVAQAKKQRRALRRDIDRDLKKKARETRGALWQKLREAYARKKARLAELVQRCRSERITLRQRLKDMRMRVGPPGVTEQNRSIFTVRGGGEVGAPRIGVRGRGRSGTSRTG